jgi:hypothetical protein
MSFGDVAVVRPASEVNAGMPSATALVPLERGLNLGDLVFRAGQADLQSFDLAVPAFAFGFDYPGLQIVADLFQPWSLRRVGP